MTAPLVFALMENDARFHTFSLSQKMSNSFQGHLYLAVLLKNISKFNVI